VNEPIRPMPPSSLWPAGMFGMPPSLVGVKPGGPIVEPLFGGELLQRQDRSGFELWGRKGGKTKRSKGAA
jgi:hypothetical protein